MSNVTPITRPINWARLNAKQAELIIRERAKDSQNIKMKTHAGDREDERAIPMPDILKILRTGYVTELPEAGKKSGEWKIKIEKRLRGEREAAAICLLIKEDSFVWVVTVMHVD